MKVSVTGASGHVGFCLCKQLIKQGAQVRALVHQNKNRLREAGVEIFSGNILDKQTLIPLFTGVEVVYHLAAQISIDKKEYKRVYETNVQGTANVVAACKDAGVKRLVHFSTIHTLKSFGTDDILDETNPLIPASKIIYENSKAGAERLVINASAEGLDAVILNPTAIIGPYDFQPSYLGQALIKIYKNQLPMLVQGGYNFVDVRDVADAAILAATNGRSGERYILSGKWLSLKDLSVKIGELTNRKTPEFLAPTWLAKAGLPFIQSWAKLSGNHPLYTAESLEILKHSSKNISNLKAINELGFNPRPIGETLKDTFDWFKENNLV
jgi:dihydroflavonol-4-reductase